MWKDWIRSRGVSKVARKMGVTRQTVHRWLNDGCNQEKHRIQLIELSGYRFTLADFSEKINEQEK